MFENMHVYTAFTISSVCVGERGGAVERSDIFKKKMGGHNAWLSSDQQHMAIHMTIERAFNHVLTKPYTLMALKTQHLPAWFFLLQMPLKGQR